MWASEFMDHGKYWKLQLLIELDSEFIELLFMLSYVHGLEQVTEILCGNLVNVYI